MSAPGTSRRPSFRKPSFWRLRTRWIVALAIAAVAASVTVVVVVTTGRHGPGHGVDGVSAHRGPGRCRVTRTLVPTCGHWWGIAPMAHTSVPLLDGMRAEERTAGRVLDIVHTYHVNGELFPTAAERALALQPGSNRLLLINWKPATDMSWRAVAHGHANGRIDRLARYIKKTFRHRFFLTIWHEPENDVNTNPASGNTAKDYRAMYQHVVSRLRADGVTWAVTVMNYMGFDNWARKPWFRYLWPGRRYVDWLAIDPYGTGARSGWTAHDFATLVNRPDGSFPGFYSWARKVHPYQPIMLAEWGVQASPSNPSGQAHFFHTVAAQLHRFPDIKALVYFDMPNPPAGEPRTYLRADPSASAAWRALVNNASLRGPRRG
jgi:hypothetical protein